MKTIQIALNFRFRTLQHTSLKIRWGILLFLNESSAIALDVRRSCIAQNAIVFRDIDLQCPVYQRAEYQFARFASHYGCHFTEHRC